jgi:SAM-dependent methyltransferase
LPSKKRKRSDPIPPLESSLCRGISPISLEKLVAHLRKSPDQPTQVQKMKDRNNSDTSWESSASWYDKVVGLEGHYYHKQIILPRVLRLLDIQKGPASLLDLGCGQGILSRILPQQIGYVGVDLSPSLIRSAKKSALGSRCTFHVQDLSCPIDVGLGRFKYAVCVLAAQNIEDIDMLFLNASRHLAPGGKFICVLNHPSFRIPRQSHWEIDPKKKCQYRRVDLYMTSLKIPIQTHPGEKQSAPTTFSFHRPLSSYSLALKKAGFTIDLIEEWCSDKKSSGKMGSMENRSRKEFPLFLSFVASKIG